MSPMLWARLFAPDAAQTTTASCGRMREGEARFSRPTMVSQSKYRVLEMSVSIVVWDVAYAGPAFRCDGRE